jgi:hypothetical protein
MGLGQVDGVLVLEGGLERQVQVLPHGVDNFLNAGEVGIDLGSIL